MVRKGLINKWPISHTTFCFDDCYDKNRDIILTRWHCFVSGEAKEPIIYLGKYKNKSNDEILSVMQITRKLQRTFNPKQHKLECELERDIKRYEQKDINAVEDQLDLWREMLARRGFDPDHKKKFKPEIKELSDIQRTYRAPPSSTTSLWTQSQVVRPSPTTTGFHFKSRYIPERTTRLDVEMHRSRQARNLEYKAPYSKEFEVNTKPKYGYLSRTPNWAFISQKYIWS